MACKYNIYGFILNGSNIRYRVSLFIVHERSLKPFFIVSGRTVVVFKSIGGLTENHIQDFQLQFTFPHK